MEYTLIEKSKKDHCFKNIAFLDDYASKVSYLEKEGFKQINKGTYTKSIWTNGTHLLKFFKEEKYNTSSIFRNYFDYSIYLNADKQEILPKLYGYSKNEFIVTEYIEGLTLNKGEKINLPELKVKEYCINLYFALYNIYKSTGYVIDDIDCNNLIYNEENESFHLVDLSAVASFSVAYFAREYISIRLLRLVEGFYSRGWISGFCLSQIKSEILLISADPKYR
jgi:hypothetical protein